MNYADIITLSPPQSTRRKHMPLLERAAQFAPFAALTGFEALIDEQARLTDRRPAVSDEAARQINENLNLLQAAPPREVRLTYFVPDPYKPGGKIKETTGTVRRVDAVAGTLLFTDKTALTIGDILTLDIL